MATAPSRVCSSGRHQMPAAAAPAAMASSAARTTQRDDFIQDPKLTASWVQARGEIARGQMASGSATGTRRFLTPFEAGPYRTPRWRLVGPLGPLAPSDAPGL